MINTNTNKSILSPFRLVITIAGDNIVTNEAIRPLDVDVEFSIKKFGISKSSKYADNYLNQDILSNRRELEWYQRDKTNRNSIHKSMENEKNF